VCILRLNLPPTTNIAMPKKITPTAPPREAFANQFASLNDALARSFYKPDFQAIRVMLGAAKSHYLGVGDPAWLFVVAPPGSGKTTMAIMGAAGLPEVQSLGSFTPSTFLSGFYSRREPGLLEKLGPTTEKAGTHTTAGNAILLVKDFTTVLSMRRETRAEILSQLREIHDGEFRKDFGTGETKVWRGRITILAAVTPVIDRHYSIFTVLGERFLQLRWHRPDSLEAGRTAIQQQGKEGAIRNELRSAIKKLFDRSTTSPPTMTPKAELRMANLAEVIAIARTHVFRSSYGNREIEYVPEPEANTRISKALAAIAKGIAALNQRTSVSEQDLQDAFRLGIDCIPENRRRLILAFARNLDFQQIPIPRTLQAREIEELTALGVITSDRELTGRISDLLQTTDIVTDGVKLMD
jgi:hypothetical protein